MTHTHSHTHQASLLLLFLLRGSVECLISSHQPPPPPPPPPPPLPPHIQTKIKGRDAFLPLPSHSSYTFASAFAHRPPPKNYSCLKEMVQKTWRVILRQSCLKFTSLLQIISHLLNWCNSRVVLAIFLSSPDRPPAHTDCWCFLWLQWGLRVNTEESVSAVSPGSVMNTWWYLTVRFL